MDVSLGYRKKQYLINQKSLEMNNVNDILEVMVALNSFKNSVEDRKWDEFAQTSYDRLELAVNAFVGEEVNISEIVETYDEVEKLDIYSFILAIKSEME